VNAEDMILVVITSTIDKGSEWQIIKGFIENLPNVGTAVLPNNFLMKAIGARYLARSWLRYRDSWLPLSR
jgi:hypothetical protein